MTTENKLLLLVSGTAAGAIAGFFISDKIISSKIVSKPSISSDFPSDAEIKQIQTYNNSLNAYSHDKKYNVIGIILGGVAGFYLTSYLGMKFIK